MTRPAWTRYVEPIGVLCVALSMLGVIAVTIMHPWYAALVGASFGWLVTDVIADAKRNRADAERVSRKLDELVRAGRDASASSRRFAAAMRSAGGPTGGVIRTPEGDPR